MTDVEQIEQEETSQVYAVLCQIAANCDLYMKNFDSYRPVDGYIDRLEKLIVDYRKLKPKALGISVSDGVGTKDRMG